MIIILGVDPFQYGADRAQYPLASVIQQAMDLGFDALALERLVFGWFSGRMTIKIAVAIEEYIIEG